MADDRLIELAPKLFQQAAEGRGFAIRDV